jgi:Ca2+-binding RTX toxin-like protein
MVVSDDLLVSTLVGTATNVEGNLLTDPANSSGADGATLLSVTIPSAGTIYTIADADPLTHVVEITVGSGGKWSIDFDNGHYVYAPPGPAPVAFDDAIGYQLIDGDGDTSSSTLTMHVSASGDLPPIVRDDVVITNQAIQPGQDQIAIPDFALLYNDSDAEGQALAITGVANGAGGTVSHASSIVTFTEGAAGDTNGGTFSYTGTAGTGSDTGSVTVDRSQRGENTLNGTGLDNILVGRDAGAGDTLLGYEGDDVLLALAGNDSLNGGAGADLLLGGLGTDTITGGTGDDAFVIDPSHLISGHDLIADYQSGDVIDLSQIFGSVGGANAANVDTLVNLQSAGANTAVMADVDGAGAGTAFVQVAVMTGSIASISVLYDAAQPPAQNVT